VVEDLLHLPDDRLALLRVERVGELRREAVALPVGKAAGE